MTAKPETLSRTPTEGRPSKLNAVAPASALPADRRHPSSDEVKAALATTVRKHGDALERLAKA